jgi:phytoene desaturase
MKKIIVIGSGFSSLSAAACLAKQGFDVTILEKNKSIGGRARQFEENGFVFDMGPSWYWMPDVFEAFYNLFGKKTSDFYDLKRLDPSYKVFWQENEITEIPANFEELCNLFEKYEKGSAEKLRAFIEEAAYKYKVGINDLVYKPGRSLTEFINYDFLKGLMKLDVFKSFSKHVKAHFKHPKLVQLMEFPVLFLGALPENTPALYSLMNYADISLGTWYPMGGMFKIVEAMSSIAIEQGVKILTDQEITKINIENGKANWVITKKGEKYEADVIVGGADYNHVETALLEEKHQSYSAKYWDTRELAPSSLIYYLGINKKLKGLLHHNLFFDVPFSKHAEEIYSNPQWPSNPLFYVCCPSKTDDSVAPEGMENIFILIPLAPDLKDNETEREKYFEMVINRMEERCGEKFKENIIYKRSYAHNDFKSDYHAFKGNAYGLANTLMQTAILKPSLKSKKVSNLFYTGQLTVPGPGVPPSIISGQVVAKEISKEFSI